MDLKLVDVGYLVPLHGCVSRSPGPQKDEGRRCETCSGKREEKKGGWSRIQGSHGAFMVLTLILAAQAFWARQSLKDNVAWRDLNLFCMEDL